MPVAPSLAGCASRPRGAAVRHAACRSLVGFSPSSGKQCLCAGRPPARCDTARALVVWRPCLSVCASSPFLALPRGLVVHRFLFHRFIFSERSRRARWFSYVTGSSRSKSIYAEHSIAATFDQLQLLMT